MAARLDALQTGARAGEQQVVALTLAALPSQLNPKSRRSARKFSLNFNSTLVLLNECHFTSTTSMQTSGGGGDANGGFNWRARLLLLLLPPPPSY